jgi:cytochrome c biogenesis protein CcdA
VNAYLADAAAALWLGILTSISPCPLATNIAAIAFIGKKVDKQRQVLLTGLSYTLGRMLVYLVLGMILVSSTSLISSVSMFLQEYMNLVLGPLLVIVGLFLLEVFKFTLGGSVVSEKMQQRLGKGGLWAAFLLGVLFALSFCPISAALFFGSTFALAVKHESTVIMPSIFGIGTAAPVVLFSFVIAFSVAKAGDLFNKVKVFEKWARRISGIVFVGVGIYLSMIHIFHL